MKDQWLQNKDIVLYGCGMEGERFIARHPGLYERIAFCIDKTRQGDFHGKPIKRIEDAIDNCYNNRIIITTLPSTYLKIRTILMGYGLVEFSHFAYMTYLEKKLVLINANCHGSALAHYLSMNKRFNRKYQIYSIPEIQDNKEKMINPFLLENTDVFIHQDIRKENKYSELLSDEYVFTKLDKNCKKIVIPNFVGMGGFLFPQQGEHPQRVITEHGEIALLYEDLVLEEAMVKKKETLQDYTEFYIHYEFPRSILEEYYRRDKEKITRREKNWDIKIWESFEMNRKNDLIFIDKDHPSGTVMKYIGRKTMEFLTGDTVFSDDDFEYEIGMPMPMIPSVKKYYGIEAIEEDTSRYYGCPAGELIPTYIKAYMWICHSMMF